MRKLLLLIIALSLTGKALQWLEDAPCIRKAPWWQARCQEWEATILESTVRIVFHGWIEIEDGSGVERINGTFSHASVIDGRYLVTHNHFGLPLSRIVQINEMGSKGISGVSVYALDGTPLVDQAPLDVFSVVSEHDETVVLDFGRADGSSPLVRNSSTATRMGRDTFPTVTAGAEVAIVDWDRQGNTRVIWTMVLRADVYEGVPILRVDHFIEQGASGGGVFLDGVHIGNNWARITATDLETGVVKQQVTMVALNR